MSAFSVREFRPEDAWDLEGVGVSSVAFGRTLTLDGAPVAYGGVFYPFADGQAWLFFHVSQSIRGLARMVICRNVILGLEQAKLAMGGASVLTYLDFRKPRAREFLVWSGFEPTREFVEIDENQFEVWRMQ